VAGYDLAIVPGHRRFAAAARFVEAVSTVEGARRAGLPWPKRPTTTVADLEAESVPDRLGRVFTADGLGEKYVGDLTYLPIAGGEFLYLTTVIDLCSRRVVGWTITDHMRADAVVDAMEDARRACGLLEGAVFHSDNDSQDTSLLFRQCCDGQGVLRSRGKVGTSRQRPRREFPCLTQARTAGQQREVR
jgi:transposase InsO family protein